MSRNGKHLNHDERPPLTDVLMSASEQAVADAVKSFAPKSPGEIIENAGNLTGEMMKKMFHSMADDVRRACKERVDEALAAQTDGEDFAQDLERIGAEHAERLNDVAVSVKGLQALIQAERMKYRPAQLPAPVTRTDDTTKTN